MKTHGIHISKENGTWHCALLIALPEGGKNQVVEVISADHFSELMTEIGNKKWIDLLNKNE